MKKAIGIVPILFYIFEVISGVCGLVFLLGVCLGVDGLWQIYDGSISIETVLRLALTIGIVTLIFALLVILKITNLKTGAVLPGIPCIIVDIILLMGGVVLFELIYHFAVFFGIILLCDVISLKSKKRKT